jgi:hypothetical protein
MKDNHRNHCCEEGSSKKCRHSVFLKRHWDIENQAHHRVKQPIMRRKSLGGDFQSTE